MATGDTTFSRQLRQRFSEAGLDVPAALGQPVYTLRYADGTTLNFIDANNETVEVVAEAGVVNNLRCPDSLLALLSCGPYGRPYPISLHCDKESGAVLLWTCLPLVRLDEQMFGQIIDSMLSRAEAVRAVLAGGPVPVVQRAVTRHLLLGRE